MTDQIRTHTDEDTSQYGGDYAITRTIPNIHPTLGLKMKGTRDSIEGADIQYRSFFRGDIWNKDNPSKEFNFALWNKDNSSTAAVENSRKHWMRLKTGGFSPCKFDEWSISETLQEVYTEKDGLLVLTGGADGLLSGGVSSYDVVMYRTAERMLEEEAKRNANAPTPSTIGAESQKRMNGVVDSGASGVASLPLQIEEVAHRYVPANDE